jgi:hypothetical protein
MAITVNRATLARQVNGEIEYIYPKTDSSLVAYDDTQNIKQKIDSIISDIPIKTVLKEEIGEIIFSGIPMSEKRIKIKKLQKSGLASIYVKMILRLLDYVSQI